METTGAPRAAATLSPSRREESQPAVIPSTSGVQAPSTSAPSTAAVPIDLLEKFFQILRPDLDLSQTLVRLAADLTSPQTAQPISPQSHTEKPTENPTEETKKIGGEESSRGKAAEVELEVMVEEARKARGEEEEDEVYSRATVVLSEGGTELNEEEEVAQPMGDREKEIKQDFGPREVEMEQGVGDKKIVVVIGDEEEVEQPTEAVSQRIGQLKEVLATGGWMAVRSVGSDAEEEEDEGTPLRRPRSKRRASTKVAAVPEERQTEETAAPEERQTKETAPRPVRHPSRRRDIGRCRLGKKRLKKKGCGEREKGKGRRWQGQCKRR